MIGVSLKILLSVINEPVLMYYMMLFDDIGLFADLDPIIEQLKQMCNVA